MKRHLILLIGIAGFLLCGVLAAEDKDPAAQELIDVVLSYQAESGLTPFSIEDNVSTGSDYTWGLWIGAIVASERTGYISREAAVEHLTKMLTTIDKLEKYHGWLYWGYDLVTLKPDSDRIGFQGWYLYSLIVVKNVYPELKEICEKLLNAVDYSVVYDTQEKFLSDFDVSEGKRLWRIPLGPLSDGSDSGHPASERRIAYQVYTYLTGDKGPWQLYSDPTMQVLEGYEYLSVWGHFNFDIAHLHYFLPEVGYYEKSWANFLKSTEIFMKKQGLRFFPARSGTLEEGLWNPTSPNTEHRETMPWITWYIDKNSPVMDYCFKPGHGCFRYYDQWNFYWSYGQNLKPMASIGSREGRTDAADSTVSLRFFINTNPRFNRPPKLKQLSFYASIPDVKSPPKGRLEIYLNKIKIDELSPSELTSLPKKIIRTYDVDLNSFNEILFKNSSLLVDPANRYDIYGYESQVSPVEYDYQVPEVNLRSGVHGLEFSPFSGKKVDPKYQGLAVEVVCDGQNIGPTVEDTCTSLMIRLGAVHNYYVWHELLKDERFLNSLVAWVGNFYNKASLARTVHNVSTSPVEVEYARPKEWADSASIQVKDLMTGQDLSSQLKISDTQVSWKAEPYHSYDIEYKGGN